MSTYTDAVLADSPVSYWRLDETSGTNAADQQAAHAGTYTGTFTLNQPSLLAGDADAAVQLGGGASARVDVTAYLPFVAGSQRTFECWAKTAGGFGGSCPLFGGSGATPPSLWFDSAVNMGFYPANVAEAAWAGAWPGNNLAVHVVLTFDDTAQSAELFINGVSKGAKATGAAYGTPGGLWIGQANTGAAFAGVIDEFAVYNGLLSASRITAHYAAAQAQQIAKVYGRVLPRRVGRL